MSDDNSYDAIVRALAPKGNKLVGFAFIVPENTPQRELRDRDSTGKAKNELRMTRTAGINLRGVLKSLLGRTGTQN